MFTVVVCYLFFYRTDGLSGCDYLVQSCTVSEIKQSAPRGSDQSDICETQAVATVPSIHPLKSSSSRATHSRRIESRRCRCRAHMCVHTTQTQIGETQTVVLFWRSFVVHAVSSKSYPTLATGLPYKRIYTGWLYGLLYYLW